MSFSISGLTNVVNQYLNSISDVGKAMSDGTSAAEKGISFSNTLGEAIRAEAQRSSVDFPDIKSMVQQNIDSHMRVDTTFENVASTQASATTKSATASAISEAVAAASSVNSTNTTDLVKEIVNAINNTNSDSTSNSDAFKGQLSTEALQELAKSSYFSGNLIQSNLFTTSDEENSSSSMDSGSSLSDLNTRYLLEAYLKKSSDTSTSIFGDFSL